MRELIEKEDDKINKKRAEMIAAIISRATRRDKAVLKIVLPNALYHKTKEIAKGLGFSLNEYIVKCIELINANTKILGGSRIANAAFILLTKIKQDIMDNTEDAGGTNNGSSV